MLRYALRQLISLGLSLLVASVLIFLVVELVPGDPATFMLGTGAQPDTIAALRQQLGLDLPLPLRYLHWLAGILQGDLGHSFTYKTPISQIMLDRMQVSLPLALMSLLLATALAFPIGIHAAAHRGKAQDTAVMGVTQIGISLPNFWFAMLLVLVFAARLRWFPAGGFPGWSHPATALKSLLLPAIALALPQAAILARVLRSALIETLDQDYIRTARAKGVGDRRLLFVHALKNAAVPIATIVGAGFALLISGVVVTETIFNIPGIGRLTVDAVLARDYPVIQALILLTATLYVAVNLLIDLSYSLFDPRIRY